VKIGSWSVRAKRPVMTLWYRRKSGPPQLRRPGHGPVSTLPVGSPKGRPMNPTDIAQSVAPYDFGQPFALPPVLCMPMGGRVGDGGSLGVLGLGVGNRHRQNFFIRAASPLRRSFRGSVLVRASLRNSTNLLPPTPGIRPAQLVCRRDARVESAASRVMLALSPGCRCGSKR